MPLAHAEDLTLQEMAIKKCVEWGTDLMTAVPRDRRRINQFVSWSCLKGAIEHSETLLLFDRFPHRNAVLLRPHRGGEVRYLKSVQRPPWSFTQPPEPDYFAMLGTLYREGHIKADDQVSREAVETLLSMAGRSHSEQAPMMSIFAIAGKDRVPYTMLYRHLLLPEHATARAQVAYSRRSDRPRPIAYDSVKSPLCPTYPYSDLAKPRQICLLPTSRIPSVNTTAI